MDKEFDSDGESWTRSLIADAEGRGKPSRYNTGGHSCASAVAAGFTSADHDPVYPYTPQMYWAQGAAPADS